MEQLISHKEAVEAYCQNIQSSSPLVLQGETIEAIVKSLSEHIVAASNDAIAIVEAVEISDNSSDIDYIVRYEWPKTVKDYLVLLRDIGIQHIRANQIAKDQVASISSESGTVINSAVLALIGEIQQQEQVVGRADKNAKALRSHWQAINDPWPALKQQLETIATQGDHLIEQADDAQAVRHVIDGIRSSLSSYIDSGVQLLHANDQAIEAAKSSITDHIKSAKVSRIASEIEHREEQLPARRTFIELSSEIEDLLRRYGRKVQLPVKLFGGEVIVKEMLVGKVAKSWLEAEAYPLIYELDDILRRSDNDRTVTTVNLRNTANLIAKREQNNEEVTVSEDLFTGAIETYEEKKAVNWSEFQHIKEELEERIETGTQVSNLYSTHSSIFDVSIESSFKTIGLRQNQLLQSAKQWAIQKLGFVGEYFDRAQGEQDLSIAEKVSRHIQHLDNYNKSSSYANIFLTKGFIGESFVVGRDAEIQRIKSAYAAWQAGQRGTVLLSGHRMSGRTLMGELISSSLFSKDTIRLVPGRSYSIAGRTYSCGHDLAEPLREIIKYGLRSGIMVLIDNAELWHDHNTTLLANMRVLLKNMDNYGDKIFFVVSTTHWVNNYLHHHLEWKDGFQLAINLDSLTKEQLAQAISIRHAATHKTLVDDQGERVTSYSFRRQCDRVHRRSDGIIGEALYAWANTIYDEEEGSSTVNQRMATYHRLPGIVTPTTGPVLKTMLMYRKINEYQMSKILGNNFSDLYRPVVKRFGQMGILGRKADNRLHVYSLVVNDIARQLHNDQWINQEY